MPPRGVSPKRKRQYEHIKESAVDRGAGEDRAEEIAARTVNKRRRQAGETKAQRGAGGRKKTSSAKSTRGRAKTTGGTRTRKSTGTRKRAGASARSRSATTRTAKKR
jgi:hypothetical protein